MEIKSSFVLTVNSSYVAKTGCSLHADQVYRNIILKGSPECGAVTFRSTSLTRHAEFPIISQFGSHRPDFLSQQAKPSP